MKFIYHEIEITRRCNNKCEHCMRGDMQPIDISDDDLKEFFSKTEWIESLTLTGGEPSIAPDKLLTALSYAKLMKTKISHAGLITNGQAVPDKFIEAVRAWNDYITIKPLYFAMGSDPYHRPVPSKNIAKLLTAGIPIAHRDNGFVLNSGRGRNISYKTKIPADGLHKPQWILNGWIMEPTYLNVKGNFVDLDGSYEDQDSEEAILCHISDVEYTSLMHNPFKENPLDRYVPPTDPGGINGNQRNWPISRLIAIAKQGNKGITYFHEEVYGIQEMVEALDLPFFCVDGIMQYRKAEASWEAILESMKERKENFKRSIGAAIG